MTRRMGIVLRVLVMVAAILPGQASFGEDRPYKVGKYGFSLILPEGMMVYTPEHPGPFTFKTDTLFIVVNRRSPGDFILVNMFAASTEKVLEDVKSSLESRDLPQSGYRRNSVQFLTIGKNQPKQAVEHLFHLQGQGTKALRQVFFVHNGKGFCFTCNTTAERYQQANQEFFDPILRSLTFE